MFVWFCNNENCFIFVSQTDNLDIIENFSIPDSKVDMFIKLSGKGVICDVFYISEWKFDQIVSESGGEGIGSLIREYCDKHFIVSRGFL